MRGGLRWGGGGGASRRSARSLVFLSWCALHWLLAICPANAEETVTLQLKWRHQFQFAGYYAALEKGYYREAGLDVRIVEAEPTMDPVDIVASGGAEYGVGSSALVLERGRGRPVVVLAAIFQHSPYVLLARADSGIWSVHDLAGKRVMWEPHSEELIAYLRQEGLPEKLLRVQPHTFDPSDLIAGRVDAASAYLTDEPFFLERAKFKYLSFSPRSGGIDFYGDNLFTTEAELRDHPARVKAFRDASLKGWRYAMDHPEEIADLIIARYSSRHGRDYLLYEAGQMKSLLRPDLVEIGYMHPGRWQHIVDVYADLGLMSKDFALTDFIYDPEADRARAQRRLLWVTLGLLAVGAVLATVTVLVAGWNRRMRREVNARLKMTEELQDSEHKFRFIAENSADVIWILDIAARRFTYVSPSAFRLRGYSPDEIMAQPAFATLTPESSERLWQVIADTVRQWREGRLSDTVRVTEIDQVHRDGHIVHTEVVTTLHADAEGQPVSVLGVTRDITERKKAEATMRTLAFLDSLTQLPNRRLLLDRLHQGIAGAGRSRARLALLFIDLDNFKPINDCLGHAAGDWLLQEVARRMLAGVRQSDTVARIGGDEFIVLLTEIHNAPDAIAAAEKIRTALAEPFVMADGRALNVSSSIGIALYPDHGVTERELLRHGDEAMYRAKKSGRDRVELYVHPSSRDDESAQREGGRQDGLTMRLQWKPAYASGNAVIDAEHRELFQLTNVLVNAALHRDVAPDAFEAAYSGLQQHVVRHFADEEAILAHYRYPNLSAHARRHAEIVDRLEAVRLSALAGQIGVGELVEFLVADVVAGHLLKDDRKFFGLLAGKSATSQNAEAS